MRVNVGTLALNTKVEGPEGAPWIVLSNSLGSNLSMWDPQMGVLTQKYRVLRYDTRGHGASDVPEGPYTTAMLVADAIALMDHFSIDKADWMGLSMGAMTGAGLAIQHGERFGRMVLADGRMDAPPPFQAMWDTRIAAVGSGGVEAIADGTLGSWLTEDWRAAHPAETAAVRTMVTATDPAGYIACCHALKGLDYFKDLGKISLPVLYLVGSEDKGASPETMRAMADATPGAEFVEIPGAAHVSNINAPDAYNAAIAKFLAI